MGQKTEALVVMLRPWREPCIKMFLAAVNDAREKYPKEEIIDHFITKEGKCIGQSFKHKPTFEEMKDVLVECKREGWVAEVLLPQPNWLSLILKRHKVATTLTLTDKGKSFAGDVLV